MDKEPNRKLLTVLDGNPVSPPPVWLMRQAGRYLPEYRELRQSAGGFLRMCYTPEHAVEITLQPIRRFGFDAAILFSDILVVPDAFGQKVDFIEGKGPVLERLNLSRIRETELDEFLAYLDPVFQAVRGVRAELPAATTLLGFCGAPWTVATYMIAGHGTPDQAPARLFSHLHRDDFVDLLDRLARFSAQYMIGQLRAGADAVQIFDSWAGVLDENEFERYCVGPVAKMVALIRSAVPEAKIIGFAKGAGLHLTEYRQKTAVDALGLDWTIPIDTAKRLQQQGAVQGMLDPTRLVAGGAALDEGVDRILEALGDGPFIFNLGHGVTPDTPIAHVERLLNRVRGG